VDRAYKMLVRLLLSVVLCAWVSLGSPLSPRGEACTPGTCTSYTQRDRLQEILDDRAETQVEVWSCDNFTLGPDPFPACDWDIHTGPDRQNNLRGTEAPGGEGTAIRIFYAEGGYVGHPDQGDMRTGSQWSHHNYGNYDTLNLEYDVYFSENFDFVVGGKLPGFYGGEGKCSGGETNDCFSTRFMWRSEGRMEIYGYLPFEECDWFCGDDICPLTVCDPYYADSFGRGAASLTVGKWHTIRQYIRMNDVGSSNGVMRYYLDGSLSFEITGLTIREDSSVYPSELYFSTFFGGSSPDYASTADCYAYFKNIRIFT